jgi:hypothetical protein
MAIIVKSMVLVCPLRTVLVVIDTFGPTGADVVIVDGTLMEAGAELEVKTPEMTPVDLSMDSPTGSPRALY